MTVQKTGQENRYWGTFSEDGFDIEVKVHFLLLLFSLSQ